MLYEPWRDGQELYGDRAEFPRELIQRKLTQPNAERIFYIRHAFRAGYSVEDIHEASRIDPWFLTQIREIVEVEDALAATAAEPAAVG